MGFWIVSSQTSSSITWLTHFIIKNALKVLVQRNYHLAAVSTCVRKCDLFKSHTDTHTQGEKFKRFRWKDHQTIETNKALTGLVATIIFSIVNIIIIYGIQSKWQIYLMILTLFWTVSSNCIDLIVKSKEKGACGIPTTYYLLAKQNQHNMCAVAVCCVLCTAFALFCTKEISFSVWQLTGILQNETTKRIGKWMNGFYWNDMWYILSFAQWWTRRKHCALSNSKQRNENKWNDRFEFLRNLSGAFDT